MLTVHIKMSHADREKGIEYINIVIQKEKFVPLFNCVDGIENLWINRKCFKFKNCEGFF